MSVSQRVTQNQWFIYLRKGKEETDMELLEEILNQNKFKDPMVVYKKIGDYARLTMKGRFLDKSIKPRNAKMTVEYKGSNDPLYITGRLASSIKSEVH